MNRHLVSFSIELQPLVTQPFPEGRSMQIGKNAPHSDSVMMVNGARSQVFLRHRKPVHIQGLPYLSTWHAASVSAAKHSPFSMQPPPNFVMQFSLIV